MSDNPFAPGETRYDSVVKFDAAVLRQHVGKISTARQEVSDANMAHASLYSNVEKDQFHPGALKDAMRFAKMDQLKAQSHVVALLEYTATMGVFDQMNLFAQGNIGEKLEELLIAINEYGEPDAEEPAQDTQSEDVADVDDGWEDDSDVAETDTGDDLAAAGETADTDVADHGEDADCESVEDMPEDSGAIFNSGKQAAVDGRDISENPYTDKRTSKHKLWNQGYNSAGLVDTRDDEPPTEPDDLSAHRPDMPDVAADQVH